MRTSALVTLLPFLATLTLSAARPHHSSSSSNDRPEPIERRSLSFGPVHSHATFETVDFDGDEAGTHLAQLSDDVDFADVARRYLVEKVGVEGMEYYFRPDSYSDPSTGITRIFAKQLLNGLEVSDGDINLNIDRYGRVISMGNSFHPGDAPDLYDLHAGPSGETERSCKLLDKHYEEHKAHLAELKGEQGVFGLVKSAAQVMFGSNVPVKEVDHHAVNTVHKSMRHIKHHMSALCEQPLRSATEGILSPVEAFVTLLPRLHASTDSFQAASETEFSSTPIHNLKPKFAPSEPPTELISGPGLDKSGVVSDVPARLMYTQISEGKPRMVWKYEVEMKDAWYEAYVDVKTGELLRIVDWASDFDFGTPDRSHAGGKVEAKKDKGGKQKPLPTPGKHYKPYSYQVFPWGVNDPTTGNITIVTEPWDKVASPLGWHKFASSANPFDVNIKGQHTGENYTTFTTTAGNNVYAHEDWEGRNNFLNNHRPQNHSNVFVYDYEEPDGLNPREYIDMVITQLFYTSNMYHDLLHRLGFDELAGNFQADNFGLGGKGGDPVICNAQDGSGYNNANFLTPPDGQAPRMRMYIWDTATPFRDGDVEAGIVIHEYTHGLSTRLTGGPANSGCLGWGEAGGMGEGWGDAFATIIRQIEEHHNFKNGTDVYSMGAWAANSANGIRHFKYTTDQLLNPHTYKTLDKGNYWGVHAIGEIWAVLMFTIDQRLVEEYGFSPTLFPPEDPSKPNDYYTKTSLESIDEFGKPIPLIPRHGNTLAAQLIVDGMKIQPCRPSFFAARDAIIQADQVRTGGSNYCHLWKAFAERGLGTDASLVGQSPWGGGIRTDGHKVPKKCRD
ncbi:hypothetical protein IAT40_004433 [Kwoniella sp. CBS 6097]